MRSKKSKTSLQWYAVRVKPTANRGRKTHVVGGTYQNYKNRQGRRCQRLVRHTGRREFVVETLLRRHGFHVFLPTKKVFRQISKHRPEKHLVAHPLLVGWVFVGWPEAENALHRLFGVNLVRGIASTGGRPHRLPQEVMARLFRRWGGDRMQADAREKHMRTHFEFKVGDQAQIVEGPFSGTTVRVIDLRDARAKILLDVLGAAREIKVDAFDLKAA